jgi:hypothetical protein
MNHCDTRNHEKIRRMDGAKRNPSSFFLGELFMSFRDFFASSRLRVKDCLFIAAIGNPWRHMKIKSACA